MHILQKTDFQLTKSEKHKVLTILQETFPGFFTDRIYYKQVPHFRLLLQSDAGEWVGQVGIDCRMMALNGVPISVFGIIDLCVSKKYQHQGWATQLLQKVEAMAKAHQADFLLLLADDHRLYLRNGFGVVANECVWLKIEEHQTLGIGQAWIAQEVMIKPLGDKPWAAGKLDMLGYMY